MEHHRGNGIYVWQLEQAVYTHQAIRVVVKYRVLFPPVFFNQVLKNLSNFRRLISDNLNVINGNNYRGSLNVKFLIAFALNPANLRLDRGISE